MLSRFATSLPIFALLGASLGFTQTPSSNPVPTDADTQWALISRPISTAPKVNVVTAEDRALVQKSVLNDWVGRSNQAKDFYTKYPSHPKAKEAHKVEAISLLTAADLGAVEEEPRAGRLGMSFRNDLSNSESDRVEVALKMAGIALRKASTSNLSDYATLYENKADGLVADFPKNGEAYRMYLSAMHIAPDARIKGLAEKVLLAPAPADVKAEAQAYLDRVNLIGTKVPLEFTAADGTSFNLADKAGKVVVAYAWTAQSAFNDAVFQTINRSSANAFLIAINIDQDVVAASAAAKKLNAPGLGYFDPRGLKSPVATRLKILSIPFCYVFGRDGKLVGYTAPDGLAALLSKAAN